MADVLEVTWRADVCFGQFLLLAFGFLVLPVERAVAEHVVEVIVLDLRLVMVGVVEAHVVDLWVLDVHCGHRQRRTRFSLSAVEEVIDGGSKPLCLLFTGKVQADLTGIPCKCDKVGSGAAY